MPSGSDRTGVMVVRIWIEGPGEQIRARLTETLDITAHEERTQGAASVEEVLAIVRGWLEAFLAAD